MMDAKTPLTADDWHMTDDLHAEQGKGDPFAAAIRATRMSMIITDPRRRDNPIVFVNDAFLKLTGYERSEVIGRNCRFLQGPLTEEAAVQTLRDQIAARKDVSIDILNYRKDGSTFWNALFISPVSNESGELLFYFASQLDVTDRKTSEKRIRDDNAMFEIAVRERTQELELALETQKALLHEVDHRVKNNLQMISSLLTMQSRSMSDEATRASLAAALTRIEALSTVHRRLYQSDNVSTFDVADFIRDLVVDLVAASGQQLEHDLDLEPVVISADRAAPLALIVNELVTNTIKHAFTGMPDSHKGKVAARLRSDNDRLVLQIADNGVGMGDSGGSDSFGLRLIKSLSRQLRADIGWKDAGPGTVVDIRMPTDKGAKARG